MKSPLERDLRWADKISIENGLLASSGGGLGE